MNLKNIPALIQSNADPIKTGSKQSSLLKLNPPFYCTRQKPVSVNGPFETDAFESYDESNARGDVISQPLDSIKSSYLINESTEKYKTDGIPFSNCCLKKFQYCYAFVKRHEKLLPNESNSFGSSSTLPGVVDLDEVFNEPFHRKQAFPHRIKPFWNAYLQVSQSKQKVDFVEYCHHFLLQMRKFISKLHQAVKDEDSFLSQFNISKFQPYSSDEKIAACNIYVPDDNCLSDRDGQKNYSKQTTHPIKLGKVYSELQIHFKAWADITEKWQASRQDVNPNLLEFLTSLHKRLSSYQTEMLVLSEKLIILRLRSFSCCAVFHTKINKTEKEWEYVLGPGYLKRLCKLVETYNRLLRQRSCSNLYQFSNVSQTNFPLFEKSTSKINSALNVFDVSRILKILALPVKDELASSFLDVLTVLQQTDRANWYDQELSGQNYASCDQFDWAMANDFEVDSDHVITHVAGYEVKNISNSKLSIDSLSVIKRLLYAQKSFILWFLNSLAANTSLLRSNVQSRSPRSVLSSQAFIDESSLASSDDEIISFSSSLVFTHMGGSFGSNRKRKTVLWRDSWDQEAVKSYSKSYLSAIMTDAPSKTLLSRAMNPGLEPEMKSENRRHPKFLSKPNNSNCFRPRFWFDAKTLVIDASIVNMLTFEVLPDGILEGLQFASQTFIIDKALERWDSYFCLALGTSLNDKCGSLPMEGCLTKTAWIYVKAVHTLMFLMERYSERSDVIESVLPRLQATLDAFHRWCNSKIQQFVVRWRLRELMQVTLGDLNQLTNLALKCLPLVENCHNYVESKRVEMPGTLQLATIHLKTIDAIITNMQSLSGYCVQSYSKKCAYLAKTSIEINFPQSKRWRQKNLTDNSDASYYMQDAVRQVLNPICLAVSPLKPRSQLATVSPAVTAILDAVIHLILDKKVQFSIQGAAQLQRDIEYVVEYVCSDDADLCDKVRNEAPEFTSVMRALWVIQTLQRTDTIVVKKPSKSDYQRSRRPRAQVRNVSPECILGGNDDNDWTLREEEFLALRMHGAGEKRLFGNCLPCFDPNVD